MPDAYLVYDDPEIAPPKGPASGGPAKGSVTQALLRDVTTTDGAAHRDSPRGVPTTPRDDGPHSKPRRRRSRVLAVGVGVTAAAALGVVAVAVHLLMPPSSASIASTASNLNTGAAPTASPTASPAVPAAIPSLGIVRGVYTLRGPATAPAGAWVVFALTGPKRLVRYDNTAPFTARLDTRKLPDGKYTLDVMLVQPGVKAKSATRLLEVRNSKAAPSSAGASGAGTSKSPGGTTAVDSSIAGQIVALTNKQRATAGCPALTVNSKLAGAAQAHSLDMAKNNYFEHNSQNGTTPFQRMTAAGYSYRMAAENIAMGQRTPADVMSAWMNSAGHRANILNCGLTQIGVGYALNGSGTPYWTQDFGTPA